MGPYLSARLWARQASPAKRSVAAACGVAVTVVAGLLVVPAASGPTEQVATDAAGLDALAPGDEIGTSDSTILDGTTPTSGPAGGTGGIGTGSAGSGPAGRGGSGGGGGPIGASGCPSSLSATDTGVTARNITVGFGTVDFSGSGATNERVSDVRADTDQVIQAYVDYANAQGGAACRTIVAKTYKINPLDTNDQTVKCRRATEDDKVFAFIDSYTTGTLPTQSCYTIDHKTPLLTVVPLGEGTQRAQYPYSISSFPSYDRAAANWVRAAKDNGFFDPAKGFKKLGLLDDDCLPDLNANIKRELAKVGVSTVAEFTFRCFAVASPADAQQAVLAFDREGVSHVFGVTLGINVGTFSVVAGQQQKRYRYGLSDAWSAADTDVLEFGDIRELDNTFATTSTTVGRPWDTFFQPATSVWCNEALRRKGLRPLEGNRDAEAAYICGNLRLFLRLAELAGPALTRRSLALSLPRVGRFSFPTISDGDFSAKLSGGDELAFLRIDAGCACIVRTREFGPAYV